MPLLLLVPLSCTPLAPSPPWRVERSRPPLPWRVERSRPPHSWRVDTDTWRSVWEAQSLGYTPLRIVLSFAAMGQWLRATSGSEAYSSTDSR